MLRRLTLTIALLTACTPADDVPARTPVTYAEKLAAKSQWAPLDYADPENWACRGTPGDTCTHDYPMARVTTDGTQTLRTVTPAGDPPIDCFFIYPTMDWQPFYAAQHTDFDNLWLPTDDTETQAGPFSSVCRVFVPYYRQANIGSYAGDPANAVLYFRRAFVDVAAAFEHYLRHWNRGRPFVLFGHSQGAGHLTYLLHAYFDGAERVTDIPGSETTYELRDRLLVGMPLGGLVYVAKGERAGGSLADVPLCQSPVETGCLITYRSYPEGFTFETGLARGANDLLNAEGFTYTTYDPARHVAACVNPALGAAVPATAATDGYGAALTGDAVRVLTGTWLVGLFEELQFGAVTTPRAKDYPGRYTAACRHSEKAGDYLAVGLHAPGAEVRDDPLDLDGVISHTGLGLHLYDVNLAMGDLVTQVRLKAAVWRASHVFTPPPPINR
jgi:hypothetical protein